MSKPHMQFLIEINMDYRNSYSQFFAWLDGEGIGQLEIGLQWNPAMTLIFPYRNNVLQTLFSLVCTHSEHTVYETLR